MDVNCKSVKFVQQKSLDLGVEMCCKFISFAFWAKLYNSPWLIELHMVQQMFCLKDIKHKSGSEEDGMFHTC